MNQQATIFDLNTGIQLKQEGMEQAARNRRDMLDEARDIAESIAMQRSDRKITMDAVIHGLIKRYGEGAVTVLGNSAGSVFKSGDWEWTGERIKSVRVRNHARELKVWRLL